MRIEVRPDCSLLLVVPETTREDQWLTFLLSRREWIRSSVERFDAIYPASRQQRVSFPVDLELTCLERHLKLSCRDGRQNRARLVGDRLFISTTGDTVEKRFMVLRRWLVREARKEFSRRLEHLVRDTGLQYGRLSIRGQKTRWGSCSAHGDLSLNYKLLFLPAGLVDHVLMHELVHTRHLNHSAAFWALLQSYDPACEENRQQLRHAGRILPAWLAQMK